MGTKFIRVHKNDEGNITHIETNDGRVVTLSEAQVMARRGDVDSLTDVHSDGTWEIRHTAGEDTYAEGHNLDELPEF